MSDAKFQLTPERREEFEEIVRRYPVRRAAMLPLLHLAQEQQGHVSPEVEEYVAELLEVPVVDVREVTTFYTLFFRQPMGRHHIRLCCSISCWIRGCHRIEAHLRERLGVESGGITPDGSFSWEAVPDCLGACEMAPMMQCDKDYYGDLTPEKTDEILDRVESS